MMVYSSILICVIAGKLISSIRKIYENEEPKKEKDNYQTPNKNQFKVFIKKSYSSDYESITEVIMNNCTGRNWVSIIVKMQPEHARNYVCYYNSATESSLQRRVDRRCKAHPTSSSGAAIPS